MPTGRRIGIDLGTTNSVVAVLEGTRPRVLPTKENEPQMRSVVGLKRRKKGKSGDGPKGEILIGDVAYENWPVEPEDTIISIKRLMGRSVVDAEVQMVRERLLYKVVEPSAGTKDSVRVVMGGQQYSPIDISAIMLKKLKEDAEFRLGEAVSHAVITVPAYFSQRQKGATREAGRLAGLSVMKILDEPTAAAIAFGMEKTDSSDPKYILVYDLGGGTFDISVLMWAGNVFAPLALQGNMWLGGDDFDEVLVKRALELVKKDYHIDLPSLANNERLRFLAALKQAARVTKERLSSSMSADLLVPGRLRDEDGDLIDFEMEVTRGDYERMIRPLVDKTVSITETALRNAHLSPEQIDHVIMAGNATCVPLVQQAMEDMFGKDRICRGVHPKQSVAMGAALVSAKLLGIFCVAPDPADPQKECEEMNDLDATKCRRCGAMLAPPEPGQKPKPEDTLEVGGIAAFPYGVQTADDGFHIFIEQGEQYPTATPKTQTFQTQSPNQQMISIPVWGGEHPEKASLNEKQGEAFAVLPPGLPKGTQVQITVWLDGDGVFDLSACLMDGRDLAPLLLRGEKDQKAVEAIEHVEKLFEEKAVAIPADRTEEIERTRREAFDALRRKAYDDALEKAQGFEKQIDEAVKPPDDDKLRQKAENLIGYTQFVLHQYGWVLNAEKSYRLNQLVEETRQALEGGDRSVLEQKVGELDRETDNLPDLIKSLLGVRGALQNVVRPVDPVAAANLIDELDEIEQAMRQNDTSAVGKFNALQGKVVEAIKKAEKERPDSTARTCSICGCGAPVQGRYCANRHDQWGVTKGPGGSTGTC